MKYSCTILLMILLFPSVVRSENLSLQPEIEPTEVVVGVPFLVKLSLKSNTDFNLHGGLGFCDSEHTKFIVKDSSGNPTDIHALIVKDYQLLQVFLILTRKKPIPVWFRPRMKCTLR